MSGEATLQPSPAISPSNSSREPLWQIVLVFFFLLVGLYLVAGPIVRLSEWKVSPTNYAWMEARAWNAGNLDIPPGSSHPERGGGRPLDTAYYQGKVYNVNPPLFSILSLGALKLQALQGMAGDDDCRFYPAWYVMLVVLPLPLLGYWAFLNATGRSIWAALLTACLVLGTPLLKLLAECRAGESAAAINAVLCISGLLLMIGDLLGRQRIWPAALGLVISIWSRQLTIFFVPAILIASLKSRRPVLNTCILFVAVLISVVMLAALNYMRFGDAFESGYRLIYEGREDLYSRRYHQLGALFDLRFIPTNFYYMNLAPPYLAVSGSAVRIEGHPDGAAIWLTSPLLVFIVLSARSWWKDVPRRNLMLCSGLIVIALLCYHTTGSVQRGYYRFALDFIPIWLAVIGGFAFTGKRLWVSLACLAYSALYFNLLVAS